MSNFAFHFSFFSIADNNLTHTGVLAVDRAEGADALISREVFDSMRDYFEEQVDYVIKPTI